MMSRPAVYDVTPLQLAVTRTVEAAKTALLMPSYQWLDYANADLGQPMINQSIDHLIDNFHAPNIDLVAHSRGNFILMNYLATHRPSSGQQAKEQLRSVNFGHADINDADFLDNLPKFASATRDINFVYDWSDKALGASKYTNTAGAVLSLFAKAASGDINSPYKWANDVVAFTDYSMHLDRVGQSDDFASIDGHLKPKGDVVFHYLMDDETGDRIKHTLSSRLVGEILRSPSKMPMDNYLEVMCPP